MRVGLVGAGEVVRRFWLAAIASDPRLRLEAVCGGGGLTARALAAEFGIPRVVADADRLVSDRDVDLVVVCAPPHVHEAVAVAALRAGKAVLVEKPLTVTHAECRRLVEAGEGARALLFPVYSNRLREDNRWLMEQVATGAIGALQAIECEWSRSKPARDNWLRHPELAGGGVLADLGSHLVTIALEMVPDRDRFALSCLTVAFEPAARVEDVALVQAVIDDRVTIQLRAGWSLDLAAGVRHRIQAYGAKGTVAAKEYPGVSGDGYGPTVTLALDCLDRGVQPDLDLFDDSMLFLESCFVSARTGRRVEGRFRRKGRADG